MINVQNIKITHPNEQSKDNDRISKLQTENCIKIQIAGERNRNIEPPLKEMAVKMARRCILSKIGQK